MTIRTITTPFDDSTIESLSAGDTIELTGTIYSGRDAAHKRLCELLDENKPLPVDLNASAIYFFGPSPTRPGKVIGSAGPTTSYRMDTYSPKLLNATGLKAMIGKGDRSQTVIDAMIKNKCIYFAAIGGAAALIAQSIKKAEVICYEDLGPEAIHKLEVVKMPLIVAIDCKGNSLYKR